MSQRYIYNVTEQHHDLLSPTCSALLPMGPAYPTNLQPNPELPECCRHSSSQAATGVSLGEGDIHSLCGWKSRKKTFLTLHQLFYQQRTMQPCVRLPGPRGRIRWRWSLLTHRALLWGDASSGNWSTEPSGAICSWTVCPVWGLAMIQNKERWLCSRIRRLCHHLAQNYSCGI